MDLCPYLQIIFSQQKFGFTVDKELTMRKWHRQAEIKNWLSSLGKGIKPLSLVII